MYAIIKTGGKQYKVKKGDVIHVELLSQEDGAAVEFSEVLLVGNENTISVGEPTVEGSVVKGTLRTTSKGPKITAMKYKPRKKSSRRKWGHRQGYSEVEITEIASK